MMNKLTLLLVAFFFMSSVVFATSVTQTVDLTQKTVAPVINVKIDLGDITNLNESELVKLIGESINIYKVEAVALQCSFTLKTTLKTPFFDVELSVTVSGDCAQAKAEAQAQLRDMVAWAKYMIFD
ncbi:MAG: hypothetical protein WCK18_01250 [Prolixibacteraceae bacterium]